MTLPLPPGVDNDAIEESRRFNATVEELLAKTTSIHLVPPEETRRARIEGRGAFPAPEVLPEGQDRTIPGLPGKPDVGVRVFVPDRVVGTYVHIHGGGWTLGTANGQDVALWRLANEASVAVVSVDYRLAPEHPYPAGPDDCEAVAVWAVEKAVAEFGNGGAAGDHRLVIGGESAGAHLTAVTLLRLRDRHGLGGAFAGANLVFGAYDLTLTPSQRAWGDRYLILSEPIMEWFYELFLPGMDADRRRDPDVSPLYADLTGMPPALFIVGTRDPLLDDSLFMAARWAAAGSAADLRVYPEGMHGFVAFPLALSRAAVSAQWDFIRGGPPRQ